MSEQHHLTDSGIHYTCEGGGPALVFIHGAGGNSAVWFQQVEAFSQTHQVICIDLPGFGLTLPREGGFDPDALSEIVLEVMDHARVEQASIIGQSLGGWFALRTALATPERIERLVLSCSMGGISHAPAITAFAAALASLGPEGLAGLTLTDTFKRNHANMAFLFRQISAFNPPADAASIGSLFAAPALIPEERLVEVECPVLIVSGEDDPIWPPASLGGLALALPHASLSVIAATGHSPYFEKPDAFNSTLLEFIT